MIPSVSEIVWVCKLKILRLQETTSRRLSKKPVFRPLLHSSIDPGGGVRPPLYHIPPCPQIQVLGSDQVGGFIQDVEKTVGSLQQTVPYEDMTTPPRSVTLSQDSLRFEV